MTLLWSISGLLAYLVAVLLIARCAGFNDRMPEPTPLPTIDKESLNHD